MKKTFSIIVIVFCFATSYAQETKPTKQETMDWIGNTLLKFKNTHAISDFNSETKYSDFSYSSGLIRFTQIFTQYDTNRSTSSKQIWTIDLSKILAFKITYMGYELLGQNVLKQLYTPDIEKYKLDLTYINTVSICTSNCSESEFNIVDENNILERLGKALDALVEFNKNEQPKEAY